MAPKGSRRAGGARTSGALFRQDDEVGGQRCHDAAQAAFQYGVRQLPPRRRRRRAVDQVDAALQDLRVRRRLPRARAAALSIAAAAGRRGTKRPAARIAAAAAAAGALASMRGGWWSEAHMLQYGAGRLGAAALDAVLRAGRCPDMRVLLRRSESARQAQRAAPGGASHAIDTNAPNGERISIRGQMAAQHGSPSLDHFGT